MSGDILSCQGWNGATRKSHLLNHSCSIFPRENKLDGRFKTRHIFGVVSYASEVSERLFGELNASCNLLQKEPKNSDRSHVIRTLPNHALTATANRRWPRIDFDPGVYFRYTLSGHLWLYTFAS